MVFHLPGRDPARGFLRSVRLQLSTDDRLSFLADDLFTDESNSLAVIRLGLALGPDRRRQLPDRLLVDGRPRNELPRQATLTLDGTAISTGLEYPTLRMILFPCAWALQPTPTTSSFFVYPVVRPTTMF